MNLVGAFIATREAMRVFKAQRPSGGAFSKSHLLYYVPAPNYPTSLSQGRIINNGSLSAHVPRPQSFPYACSKHGMTGLTKCTALDGREFGITCTQIDIGNAHTDMGGQHTMGALQPNGTIVPEPSIDVAHVANTIVHIASLPLDVAMLEVNIMFVSFLLPVLCGD